MARPQQRRGGFTVKARKLMALCAGGVLLLSSGSAFADTLGGGLLARKLSEGSPLSPPEIVTCSAPAKQRGAVVERHTVVLSESKLSTTIKCPPGGKSVPTELSQVCYPLNQESFESCKSSGTVLKELLETNNPVAWAEPEPKSEPATRTLSLTKEDLPFADKSFFVGCDKSEAPNTPCQIDITVRARSSTVDKNVVTCAYGAESNPRALQVRITKENNTLTIACGKNGTIKPAIYQDCYCEDEKLSQCSRSYKDILPRFDSSWWTKEGEAPAAETLTLTIPKEEFPAEEQKFYVGCALISQGDDQRVSAVSEGIREENEASAKGPTVCKVLVTVSTAATPSHAGSALHPVAAVSAATAVAGLWSNAL
ncbi:SAG-related sequence [Besnoitia besnoiti]|uniref:SAG-related sequence n=1 Tax=Besnoitia besnoiti TaxID=94643 RepID=A0A2A9MN53_BESBE|nr:SAG-related sequence [Besnoitia besnoiti]PFH37042.1 SAG-related sequence [Besnoitia besnoiti]